MEFQKVAAEQTYDGQADLGRQLAEAEFRRQVEFGKLLTKDNNKVRCNLNY